MNNTIKYPELLGEVSITFITKESGEKYIHFERKNDTHLLYDSRSGTYFHQECRRNICQTFSFLLKNDRIPEVVSAKQNILADFTELLRHEPISERESPETRSSEISPDLSAHLSALACCDVCTEENMSEVSDIYHYTYHRYRH